MAVIGQALKIHLAPTTDGSGVYMQITSEDGFSINIVLVATEVIVEDNRPKEDL